MDIHEIKVLLAVHVGNEKLVLKTAGGKKLAGSNDYFIVTDDGICHLFDANGIEKDVSTITTLSEDIVSKDIKKIVIPSCVTYIRGKTFSDCSGLTSVTIPDLVTSIGQCAFQSCSSLTSMVIGNNVTAIGWRVFSGCSNLKSVVFKGKTLQQVKAMWNYPFGIEDESIIKCIDEMHAAA